MDSKIEENPLISIITIVFNGRDFLENTILSVVNQSYKNIEYIIIDGASSDGTLDIINKYNSKTSTIISEPDKGIYDAMNKGISFAHGDWINFMNSGDCFENENVLTEIFKKKFPDEVQIIYSDYYILKRNRRKKYYASFDQGIILHQSCIYRRSLHLELGKYYVSSPIILSDYLFFNLIPRNYYFKTDTIISVNDGNGISSGSWIITQKYCLDYVFNRIGFIKMVYLIIVGYLKHTLLVIISKFPKR